MVVSKNAYLTLAEQQENALYITGVLSSLGWTRNSIAGMLGNMQTESTINPGIWQNLTPSPSLGLGLVQWTPSTKLTTWMADNGYTNIYDIDGQLARIEWELANNVQWIATTQYPLSFSDFKHSLESPEYLAQAFLKNYERPRNQNQPNRSTQARYWYDFINSGIQVAKFPLDYMYITQGEDGQYSHQGTLAIDFIGRTTRYPYYAPVDMECVANWNGGSIRVWSTVNPALCCDGEVRHFTMSAIHDEIDWVPYEGYIASQGSLLGFTGAAGNATGDHVHFQAIEGNEFNGFTTNSQGASTLVGNELHLYDIFDCYGVDIVEGMGYPWSTNGFNPDPPKPKPKKEGDLLRLWLSKALYTKGW